LAYHVSVKNYTHFKLYVFFWVISRRLNFIFWRFGTLSLLHLHRQVGVHLPAYESRTESSETSAYKVQTPGNYSEENIQHTEQGEGLKSSILTLVHVRWENRITRVQVQFRFLSKIPFLTL